MRKEASLTQITTKEYIIHWPLCNNPVRGLIAHWRFCIRDSRMGRGWGAVPMGLSSRAIDLLGQEQDASCVLPDHPEELHNGLLHNIG